MPKKFTYKTVLVSPDRGGVYAPFPYDGIKEFGKRGTVRVNAWIDGYHKKCSLLPMGDGTHAIMIKQLIRKTIKKEVGDEVKMVVEQDLSPRIVVIPEDIQWLLDDDTDLKNKFLNLSISIQESILAYINEAKRPETRAARIEKMLDRVKEGFKRG